MNWKVKEIYKENMLKLPLRTSMDNVNRNQVNSFGMIEEKEVDMNW